MATIVLQTVGSVVGGMVGGPIGAMGGRALGALAGAAIDNALFSGSDTKYVEGPRLKDIDGLTSTEGAPIPRGYGLIGLSALVLGLFGFDGSALSTGAVEEALVQLIAAGSFIASTLFRILATKQILN
ncbi:hypothetical protein [Microvirga arabica]|uniref:Uncharacterized protein n=1 Tax=Microvirga arabica TaxID=1128671 RepID=A0ABV6Y4T8_9HYPH|nr:hypothetical protein [Microvirga arabica]MBM1174848.1 hypothetical protein [Microvirga arabica]